MTDRPITVAGHRFNANGVCTILTDGGGPCAIRWHWIRDCTDDSCAGMLGIAHTDKPPLNLNEIAQIRAMRAWEGETCMAAVRGAGTGAAPVAADV